MDLNSYLSAERGRASWLAGQIKVSAVTVHQWANGIRQVPAERCPEIERATAGAVTCEELRPDLAAQWAYLRGAAKEAA
jgi:DNA-binding transcriptional regulator YdaS (Cro superfamily)